MSDTIIYNSFHHVRQQASSICLQTFVSTQKFLKSALYYRLEISTKELSKMEKSLKIPECIFKFLRKMSVTLRKHNYDYREMIINIPQKQLAQEWGVDVSTIRRWMKAFQNLGGEVDTTGEKFPKFRHLFINYKNADKPTKQYFINFEGFFKYIEELLIQKRKNHVARQESEIKKQERNSKMETQVVDKVVENREENSRINQKGSCKNARYNEIINNFNKYKKNIFKIFNGIVEKSSLPFHVLEKRDLHEPPMGPDDGTFSDLFKQDIEEWFKKLTPIDQKVFLMFKRKQIMIYIQKSSPYSRRQIRANKGLAILQHLEKYHLSRK